MMQAKPEAAAPVQAPAPDPDPAPGALTRIVAAGAACFAKSAATGVGLFIAFFPPLL